jgi:hypothetical protein
MGVSPEIKKGVGHHKVAAICREEAAKNNRLSSNVSRSR